MDSNISHEMGCFYFENLKKMFQITWETRFKIRQGWKDTLSMNVRRGFTFPVIIMSLET